MASKRKKNVSRFIREARTAAAIYKTASETLPSDDEGRKVGYVGLQEQADGKRRLRIQAEHTTAVDAYGLDLYTVAERDLPMSLVAHDYEQIPLDFDAEYAEYRTELRANLGKLLDSL
jgi:hypothetical protein